MTRETLLYPVSQPGRFAYADTSFLFSLYVPDANSAAASAMMRRTMLPIISSDLGEFEFANAVCGRVFTKDLRPHNVQELLDLFSKDIAQGILRSTPLSTAALARGRQLARSHTPKVGTRGLDVLHVASALVFGADVFFTFDRGQAVLAAAVGLKTS
jgi:predicted nucleic acid-binding protein